MGGVLDTTLGDKFVSDLRQICGFVSGISWRSVLLVAETGGQGEIRVITKLPNSEQSHKGKVKTHKYINRQNQSTTGKL
jgi:hypothetical protein